MLKGLLIEADALLLVGNIVAGIGIAGSGTLVKLVVPFLQSKGFSVNAIWSAEIGETELIASTNDIPVVTQTVDDLVS